MKRAFITGITGQDGSWLSELLLEKGYQVYGLVRRKSNLDYGNVEHIHDKIQFIFGDVCDFSSLTRAIEVSDPDEIYNLASQSSIAASWEQPVVTAEINAIGAVNVLEAMRRIKPAAKFYQASSGEMFGHSRASVQDENTPFDPKSPYAVSKLYAHQMTKTYRHGYNLHACSGILFNHESERRGKEFVTRKITGGVAEIKHNRMKCLELGNLDIKRDWGHAKDYVYAMWLMLQQAAADDYVVATNKAWPIRRFVEKAFHFSGIEIKWRGSGPDETGINRRTGEVVVRINPKFFRPLDHEGFVGDSAKARNILNWKPAISFDELVRKMVEHDLMLCRKTAGDLLRQEG